MKRKITINRITKRAAGGFTLIELLTVIGIIVIVLAVSLPAINKLTQGNSVKQATNMVSALVANARSLAISSHSYAGVVFYEETYSSADNASGANAPVAWSWNPNQTAACLIMQDQSPSVLPTGINVVFKAASNSQYLPTGIRVAMLDDSANFRTAQSSTGLCRAIVFDGNGQLTNMQGLAAVTTSPLYNNTTSPRKLENYFNFISPNGAAAGASSCPGIMFYDGKEFDAMSFAVGPGGDAARTAWIKGHADILIVNAYTGNVIR